MGSLGGSELGIGLPRQMVLPKLGLAMGCQGALHDEGGVGDIAL